MVVIPHLTKLDITRSPLAFALLAGALAVSGCAAPQSRYTEDVAARCDDCRGNVHVIFVRSPVDAADVAGLANVAESMRLAGFCNTKIFNTFQDGRAEDLDCRLRKIHQCHPGCRVMLVGFSSGALIARNAAKCLEAHQLCIDSLVYVDSSVLHFVGCGDEPCNVRRHLLIYRDGTALPATCCGEASVCRIPEWNHLKVPSHECTVDALFCEAIRLSDEASRCQSLPIPTEKPAKKPARKKSKRKTGPEPKVPYESLPELPTPEPKRGIQLKPVPQLRPVPRSESTQVILLPAPPRIEPAQLAGRVEFDEPRIASEPLDFN